MSERNLTSEPIVTIEHVERVIAWINEMVDTTENIDPFRRTHQKKLCVERINKNLTDVRATSRRDIVDHRRELLITLTRLMFLMEIDTPRIITDDIDSIMTMRRSLDDHGIITHGWYKIRCLDEAGRNELVYFTDDNLSSVLDQSREYFIKKLYVFVVVSLAAAQITERDRFIKRMNELDDIIDG